MSMLRRRLAAGLAALVLIPATVQAQREIPPEARIFQQYREGVFKVFGDGGHGTGFLVDPLGLVVTNQHVVAQSSRVSVELDPATRVRADVLVADTAWDLAVLRVHPQRVVGRPVLRAAPERPVLAYEGERVLAIGSPLNQTTIITSGIVSKVEEGALISDVNINPGSSGGPLINLDGEVIGINTFLESERAGPGVSGSLPVTLVRPLLERARALVPEDAPPSAELLPVMPDDFYPLYALERAATAEWWDPDAYSVTDVTRAGTGDFRVTVYTPAILYRAEKKRELELAEKRREREEEAGAPRDGSYSPFDDLKRWAGYAGAYRPVVVLEISPKVGQTSGSALLNILGAVAAGASGSGYYGHYSYEFKADLQDVEIRLDGEDVLPIRRSLSFVPLDFRTANLGGSYSGEDLAKAGILLLDPAMFRPGANGWPWIALRIYDLEHPDAPVDVSLPRRTIERVWLDFEPHRVQLAADTTKLIAGR